MLDSGRWVSNSSRCRIVSIYLSRTWCLYTWSYLDNLIIIHFSINCSTVICSPTVILMLSREAISETYGPRVYFPSYKFPIYNISFLFTIFAIFYFLIYKPKVLKIFTLPFIYLYHISLLQVTVKVLTIPLSRWVQVCLIVCAGISWFERGLLLDWYLGSQKLREILTLLCCIIPSS